MKKKYLITTCLDYFKNKNKKSTLLAGDWCLRDTKSDKIIFKNIFPSIWNNIKIQRKDIKIQKKIHGRLCGLISNYLFTYHNKKIPKKILSYYIHVWLVYYISFYFYKWKTLNKIFSKNSNLIFRDYKTSHNPNFNNTKDFYNTAFKSNFFNYVAFKRIINFKKKNNLTKINIIKKNESLKNDYNEKKYQISFKENIIMRFINFYQKIFNRKLLILDGLNYKLNILTNIKYFQIPIDFTILFKWPDKLFKRKKNIRKIHIETKTNDKFEKFLIQNLYNDIPSCFTFNFNLIDNQVNKIKLNPDKIITSAMYIHNDFVKLWLLKKKFINKKKLIFIEHGGGHHILGINWYNYQQLVGDIYIPWKNSSSDEIKNKIPNPKYLFNIKTRKKNSNKIIYVTSEIKDYVVHNRSGPMSIKENNIFSNFDTLSNNLKKDIVKNLYFLTKSELSTYFKDVLNNILSSKKVLKPGTLNSEIPKSKLIICTYPQTSFIDSLLTGPTILLYNSKQWPPDNDMKKFYNDLKKNKIAFEDPVSAAKHINSNWNNLNAWWNKENVKKSRMNYLKKFNVAPNRNNSFFYYLNKLNSSL
tara:strand:- start:2508 stop:4259 length:1752 start_codon:yes stop_codon:yes gene_type:complete